MGKYLFDFTQEGKNNEKEMQAGSGVVFTYLFHCVFERGCYLVCSNNTQHVKHVVKETCDLNSSLIHPVCLFFLSYTKHRGTSSYKDSRNVQTTVKQGSFLKHSLPRIIHFHNMIDRVWGELMGDEVK